MKIQAKTLPKSTMEMTVTIPVVDVKATYEEVLSEVVKNAEINGFRKGQAPRDLVEEKSQTSELYGDVINKLLQKFYPQALKEQHINPISNPKVEIKGFDLNKDFEFTATIATKPEIKIGDFRKELKKVYEEKNKTFKKENEERLKKGEKIEIDHIHLNPNTVVDALVQVSKLEIPELLIDEESDRITSRLVEQAQSVGISLEQYLTAQGKTADQLREEHKKLAEQSLRAEFVLAQLVKEEKIEATEEDIENTAKATGDENIINNLKDPLQKWYIKSVLEKNMLINKLIEEIQGEHHHDQ
ncbi:MAG: trigger factor [Patescibacteria group bacterium]|jgi:FKBP-type peptidyl-prolyl cis-trans isomerase (trigger factor)